MAVKEQFVVLWVVARGVMWWLGTSVSEYRAASIFRRLRCSMVIWKVGIQPPHYKK